MMFRQQAWRRSRTELEANRPSSSSEQATQAALQLASLNGCLLSIAAGLGGIQGAHIRERIRSSRDMADLGLARAELFQQLSLQQSQSSAAEAINAVTVAAWQPIAFFGQRRSAR